MDKKHWLDWFKSLPANEIKRVRKAIIDDCKVSRSAVDNWTYSYQRVPQWQQSRIEMIAGIHLDFTFTHRSKMNPKASAELVSLTKRS